MVGLRHDDEDDSPATAAQSANDVLYLNTGGGDDASAKAKDEEGEDEVKSEANAAVDDRMRFRRVERTRRVAVLLRPTTDTIVA